MGPLAAYFPSLTTTAPLVFDLSIYIPACDSFKQR